MDIQPILRVARGMLIITIACLWQPAGAATEALAESFWAPGEEEMAPLGAEAAATVGEITHQIFRTEAMQTIPAWRAAPQHRGYARDLDADAGKIWYVVRGASLNGSRDTRRVSASSVVLVDANGTEYKSSWSASMFLPDSLKLQTAKLSPGQYKHWLAFFELPQDVSNARLRLQNMARVEPQSEVFPLPGLTLPTQKRLGSVVHQINAVHRLDEIPAEWTVEKYKSKAQPKPARPGFLWLIVSGGTMNVGKEERRLSSGDYVIVGEDGSEHRSGSPGYRYQNADDRIKSDWLAPGAVKHWTLFFELPTGVQHPSLRLGNLKRVRAETTTLGLTDASVLLDALASVPAASTRESSSTPTGQATDDAHKIDLGLRTVVTGDVEHVLVSAEVLPAIPAERMTKEWQDRGLAESLPAPDNTVWIHVVGSSTNNSTEERLVNATFSLIDSSNREFKVNVSDTQFYVEEDRSLLFGEVAPGQSREWDAWFLVHSDAQNLRLKLDDLTFLAEFTAEADLPIDNDLISNRGVQ